MSVEPPNGEVIAIYKVTLPGIAPEFKDKDKFDFPIWRCGEKWGGQVIIPPMLRSRTINPVKGEFVFLSDSGKGVLEEAKKELSQKYPGAMFSWDEL